ncbi:glucuronide transporter [Betaproteobacteria bacterium]|nr:glucuronide transporter [Betaproteobacteria bacterium]
MTDAKSLQWSGVIGYGLGDMANSFVFSMGLLFLLPYYTDVAGIGAAAAGTLLLTVRIYDAAADVAAGRIIDSARIPTRLGRFRPWLLWVSAPLLLLNVAVFSVPSGWSGAEKLVYAYITYALLGTAFSFITISYGSLAAVMTQLPRERSRLAAVRSLMSMSVTIFLASALGPAFRDVQGEALQSRLTMLTLVLAVLGMAFYAACFLTTRETVTRQAQPPAWRDSWTTLVANRALHVLCVASLCALAGAGSLSASAMYFARYVLGDATYFLTFALTTTPLGMLVSVLLGPMLVARFGKKMVFQCGMAIAAAAHFLLFFTSPVKPVLAFVFLALGSISLTLAMVVAWALQNDTVEYGEWKSGMRLEGLNYSLFSLTRKCGLALGGSLPAFLLAASAYVPNQATQDAGTLRAILAGVALAPAMAFSLAFVVMFFYPLSDLRFLEIVREIEARAMTRQSR